MPTRSMWLCWEPLVMGETATPPPSDRAATRATARAIIEAVEADERMPGLEYIRAHDPGFVSVAYAKNDVDSLLLALAQEVVALANERDEARAVARVLAHAYKRDSMPPLAVVREAMAFPVRPEKP